MPHEFEVEQKFALADPERLQGQLTALGAAFCSVAEQTDRYFSHPAHDFARTDEALRIRQTPEGNFITYKGPKLDPQTKTRRKLELPLSAGREAAEAFATLLEALGFRPVAEVRKRRRRAEVTWQGFPLEISLDEVEGVGRFIELEVAASQETLDAARNAVAALAQHLGLLHGERRSYLELLLLSASDAKKAQQFPPLT